MGKSKTLFIISINLFIISISFLLFPFVNNFIYQLNNKGTINEYDTNVSSLSKEDKQKYLDEAKEYNESLTDTVSDAFLGYSYDDIEPDYESVLNFNNGQICSVEIPKINVHLPVYHGTSEEVLKYGASHSANTSFPIGGANTHSVISAHTAYPSKIFFDDLPKLEIGDKFYINILDEQLTYKVCDINIVEPDDTSLLQIEYQKDLITLVTCYPYAVNSHRLFVTGKRTEDIKISTVDTPNFTEAKGSSPNIIIIILITIGLTIIIIVTKKVSLRRTVERKD